MHGLSDADIAAACDAGNLARKIGDTEWEKGNTKFAFEAWEASSIKPAELYAIARKLAEAETIIRECQKNLERVDLKNIKHNHAMYHVDGLETVGHPSFADDGCQACKARGQLTDIYLERVFQLLGWKIPMWAGYYYRGHSTRDTTFTEPNYYRSATVACLKLIRRIYKVPGTHRG